MRNNINKILREKEITQGQLADMVGVKREYINRIINRKIDPSVRLAMKIAEALGVDMSEGIGSVFKF